MRANFRADALVALRGGMVLPVHVIAWMIAAEDRGLSFAISGEKLRVSPAAAITTADEKFIYGHRDLLKQAVVYIDLIAREPS